MEELAINRPLTYTVKMKGLASNMCAGSTVSAQSMILLHGK
jgi:hypothetical protein